MGNHIGTHIGNHIGGETGYWVGYGILGEGDKYVCFSISVAYLSANTVVFTIAFACRNASDMLPLLTPP